MPRMAPIDGASRGAIIPSVPAASSNHHAGCMRHAPDVLYAVDIMSHRTQLYLDDAQHAWLVRQAGVHGSIAAVVRRLVNDARTRASSSEDDPLLELLLGEPADGATATSVTTLDDDLYGT